VCCFDFRGHSVVRLYSHDFRFTLYCSPGPSPRCELAEAETSSDWHNIQITNHKTNTCASGAIFPPKPIDRSGNSSSSSSKSSRTMYISSRSTHETRAKRSPIPQRNLKGRVAQQPASRSTVARRLLGLQAAPTPTVAARVETQHACYSLAAVRSAVCSICTHLHTL